jgi:chorismate synthase
MAVSGFGRIFRITTWGESHGPALGVVIDGCPAGLTLCEEDIQVFLDRRKPGASPLSTPRSEADKVKILSGVFEGVTTGAPISLMVENTSQRSSDYGEMKDTYRPGHADYCYDAKYGIRDYRGGGRSSGRETIGRVAAGAIASKILSELGISVEAYTSSIGPVKIREGIYSREQVLSCPTAMPDAEADREATEYVKKMAAEKNSVGGTMECVIRHMPAGVGDPVFDKLDALLASAVMSIGAVKAVEIGDGTAVSTLTGRENNDPFTTENGKVTKTTNHSGGILGGISDGTDILVRASVKPTPSIFSPQETVNKNGDPVTLTIAGRHDPVIIPRAVVVMEAMCAITVLDALLVNQSARLQYLKDFYN